MGNKNFVSLFLAFILVIGFSVLVIHNWNDFSVLENRDLAHEVKFSGQAWLDGDFQDSLENVLADQFLFRTFWVSQYNKMQIELTKRSTTMLNALIQDKPVTLPTQTQATSETTSQPSDSQETVETQPPAETTETGQPGEEPEVDFLNLLVEGEPDEAMQLSVTRLNKDVSELTINGQMQLIRSPLNMDNNLNQAILQNIQKINQFEQDINGEDVAVYLVESARFSHYVSPSVNMQTLQPLIDQLSVPHDYFPISRISDLQNHFYHTDHHWNDVGSYLGYRGLVSFLQGDEDRFLYPKERQTFDQVEFLGSVSRMTGHSVAVTPDKLSKLIFDLPAYEVKIGGDVPDEYGHLSYYESGDQSTQRGFDHYNFLFQKREELIEFNTGKTDRDTVLFISDSMSNPIRELIASHFNKSYFISLGVMYQKDKFFKVEDFLDEHPVDRIVFFLSVDNLMPDGELQYFIG